MDPIITDTETAEPVTQWPHGKAIRINPGSEGGFAMTVADEYGHAMGQTAFFSDASDLIAFMLAKFGRATQANVYNGLDLVFFGWGEDEAEQSAGEAADQEADWPPAPESNGAQAVSVLDQIDAAQRLLEDAGYTVRRDPPAPEFIGMGGPGPQPFRPKKPGVSSGKANTQAVAGRVAAIGKAMAASDFPASSFED